MMPRYIIAYAAWLAGVLAMAAAALAWYRHVERIGVRELGQRMKTGNVDGADATSSADSG